MSKLKTPTSHPTETGTSEAGFSLIEALVVLAISSLLLVVLTDTLVASQRGHQRLEDHFERRGEVFYLDLQMQALIDHIYVNPLLHQTGWQPAINDRRSRVMTAEQWADREQAPVFTGSATTMTGEVRNVLNGRGDVEPFEFSWETSNSSRRLRLVIGEMDVTWPRDFPVTTVFRYATASGELADQWPLAESIRTRLEGQRLASTSMPTSIHLFDTSQSLTLAVYDVPQ